MENNGKLEKGFYYHYKHDPQGKINNYAYYVVGLGFHTEIENKEDREMVIYLPLYPEAFVYQNGKAFDIRPLKMFQEKVILSEKEIFRFTKITDDLIIEALSEIKREMYGE